MFNRTPSPCRQPTSPALSPRAGGAL
jgi:hypothetical protein